MQSSLRTNQGSPKCYHQRTGTYLFISSRAPTISKNNTQVLLDGCRRNEGRHWHCHKRTGSDYIHTVEAEMPLGSKGERLLCAKRKRAFVRG